MEPMDQGLMQHDQLTVTCVSDPGGYDLQRRILMLILPGLPPGWRLQLPGPHG